MRDRLNFEDLQNEHLMRPPASDNITSPYAAYIKRFFNILSFCNMFSLHSV